MPRNLATLFSIFTFLVTVGTGCNGPLPFLGGGVLSGEVISPPVSWSEWTSTDDVIQLETNPIEPYSVNIAYTIIGEQLYVYAGDTKTQWLQDMETDPDVRFRRQGVIYELRAERVMDGAESTAFGKVWAARGFYSRDPETLDEIWLYRLQPRP
jgi:hypothetical protein